MADAYLLENGADRLLLEDGSGVLLTDDLGYEDNLEGGADAVAITSGNTVFTTPTGSLEFDTGIAGIPQGSTVARLFGGTASILRRDHAAWTFAAARIYARLAAAPTANTEILAAWTGPNTTSRWDVRITTTMAVQARIAQVAVGTTTTWTVPADAWYRLEARVDASGAAGTHTLNLRLFTGANLHGTTPDQTHSVTGLSITGSWESTRTGRINVQAADWYLDSVAWSTVGWVGPVAGGNAPGGTPQVRTVSDDAGVSDSLVVKVAHTRAISDDAGAGDAVVVAATYSTDFSEYTAGSPPADWAFNAAISSTDTVSWNVELVGGVKVLRIVSGTVQQRRAFWWNDVPLAADVEVLYKARVGPGTGNSYLQQWVRHNGGAAGSDVGYLSSQLTATERELFLIDAPAATFTQLAVGAATVAADTWYWFRTRANGTTVSTRIWADGSAEPAAWLHTVTNAGVAAAGRAAVGLANPSRTQDVGWYAVAVGGGTAPSPAAGTAHQRTVADLAGVTDATVVVEAHRRTLTDVAGAADTLAVVVSHRRTASDDAGVTDDFVVALSSGGLTHTVTNDAGLTDAFAAVVRHARIVGDSAGISDTTVVVEAHRRTVGDSAGVSDAFVVTTTHRRTVGDAAGSSDATAAAAAHRRTVGDLAGVDDATAVAAAHRRTLTDDSGATDVGAAESVVVLHVDNVVDAAGAADSFTVRVSHRREAIDVAGVTDTVAVYVPVDPGLALLNLVEGAGAWRPLVASTGSWQAVTAAQGTWQTTAAVTSRGAWQGVVAAEGTARAVVAASGTLQAVVRGEAAL